jgi:hypothetical protein
VDRIVAEKTVQITKSGTKMMKFFLIHWLGHSDSENTWEPHHHVCDQLILEWNELQKKNRQTEKHISS